MVATALLATAARAEDTPLLTIDAGGHTDLVTSLIPIGNDQLLSSSLDKSIRLWNWHQGTTLRVIRGQAGIGRRGEIRHLALSPDGRTLVAGGFFDDQEKGAHPIRVYRWPEGTVAALLPGHDRPVNVVTLSPSGEFLASGDQRGVVRLWVREGQSFRAITAVEAHTRSISSIQFDPTGSDLMVSTSSDGSACFWQYGRAKLAQTKKLQPSSLPHVTSCSIRRDGAVVAFTGSQQFATGQGPYGEVVFYDRQGKKIGGSWGLETGARCVRFSPDGNRVVVGCGYPGTDKRVLIFSFPEGQTLTQFKRHDDSVSAVVFLPDGNIASAGGQDNAIRLWNAATDAPITTLTGGTRSVWNMGVSSDGRKILWGDRLFDPTATYGIEKYNDRGPLEYGFDFSGPDLLLPDQVKDEAGRAVRGSIASGGETLRLLQDPKFQFLQYGEKGPRFGSKLDNDVVYGATFLPFSKGLIPGGSVPAVMVGSSRALGVFDPSEGTQIRRLEGHTGDALSVAPSPLGDFAVSGGGDQTVRLWHLPTGRLLLTIFRSATEWVAFTPEGYYAASPQGDRLIGWQINKGEGKNPDHFLAAQFQKSLYRPDVIRLLLQTANVRRAVELANEKLGKTDQNIDIITALPPLVKIVKPAAGATVADAAVSITAVAESRGSNPVTALQLLVDGRPFEGQKGRQKFDSPKLGQVTGEWSAKLAAGTHRLSVQAESSVSKATSAEVEITCGDKGDALENPALYILAIGIAAYKDEELKLNYSALDAAAIERVFREKSSSLFRKIESRIITDDKATDREIRKGLSWFQQQMTANDVGVVFFSGHGQKDAQGIFYLLPVDVDLQDLSSTGVPEERLKSTISGTPGRVLVLLDACHAGAFAGDKRKSATPLTDDLARDLINDDYGTIVFCSSMGREFSLESNKHRQSYFTLALTEGLSGKADANNDSTVYLHELKFYLTERIKELTNGQQHPVLSQPATIRTFPLSKR